MSVGVRIDEYSIKKSRRHKSVFKRFVEVGRSLGIRFEGFGEFK